MLLRSTVEFKVFGFVALLQPWLVLTCLDVRSRGASSPDPDQLKGICSDLTHAETHPVQEKRRHDMYSRGDEKRRLLSN